MPTDQGDGTRPRVAASIPQNQKYALDVLADARSAPGNRTYVAEIIREAIEDYLRKTDDLPPEARDALDEDLLSNGGEPGEVMTDGGVECWYCAKLETDGAHPTCDHPACERDVHGYGPEGKKTLSYCPSCRDDPLVADGGLDAEQARGSVRPGDVVVTVGGLVVRCAETDVEGFVGVWRHPDGKKLTWVDWSEIDEYHAREQDPDPAALVDEVEQPDQEESADGDDQEDANGETVSDPTEGESLPPTEGSSE